MLQTSVARQSAGTGTIWVTWVDSPRKSPDLTPHIDRRSDIAPRKTESACVMYLPFDTEFLAGQAYLEMPVGYSLDFDAFRRVLQLGEELPPAFIDAGRIFEVAGVEFGDVVGVVAGQKAAVLALGHDHRG